MYVVVLLILTLICIVGMHVLLHKIVDMSTKETFKAKKKGKKSKKVEIDPDEKTSIEFTVDFDEIIDKVNEAQEEEVELPDDENELDPEDDEEYNSPGDGGPGDDTADDLDDAPEIAKHTSKISVNKYKSSRKKTVSKQQSDAIAKQSDYFVVDLLHFALVEQSITKRVICVIPERYNELYIFQINRATGTKAILIGPSDTSVILKETRPIQVEVIDILGNRPYNDVRDYSFVIFFDEPQNHPFFKWLNTSTLDIKLYDYLHLFNDGIASLLTKYPYFHVDTVDISKHIHGRILQPRFVATMKVNKVVYSNKEFKQEFYTLYDQLHGSAPLQSFYELFFDYYTEILKHRLNIDQSVKHKDMIPKQETTELFAGAPSKRALININKKMDSLVVVSTQGVHFRELHVDLKEIKDTLHASPRIFDQIQISNQRHRSLEGQYYIVWIDDQKLLLQSRILLKHLINIKMINETRLMADRIDRFAFRKLKPFDKVYFRQLSTPGFFIKYSKRSKKYYFQLLNEVLDDKYICYTNNKLQSRSACNSKFDSQGNIKAQEDVWDRPCMYDEECPFFGKGSFSQFRGGCLQGYCEMPVGVQNVSFRKFTIPQMTLYDAHNIRFAGDLFEK